MMRPIDVSRRRLLTGHFLGPIIRSRRRLVVLMPVLSTDQLAQRLVRGVLLDPDQNSVRSDVGGVVDHPFEDPVDTHDLLVIAKCKVARRAADGPWSHSALKREVKSVVAHHHSRVVLLATAVLLAVGIALPHRDVRRDKNTISHQFPSAGVDAVCGSLSRTHFEPGSHDLRHRPEACAVVGHRPLPGLPIHPHPRVVAVVVFPLDVQAEPSPADRGLVQYAAATVEALAPLPEIPALVFPEEFLCFCNAHLATVLLNGLAECFDHELMCERIFVPCRVCNACNVSKVKTTLCANTVLVLSSGVPLHGHPRALVHLPMNDAFTVAVLVAPLPVRAANDSTAWLGRLRCDCVRILRRWGWRRADIRMTHVDGGR
mmetsp:Transcript_28850/g.69302  ORF Transcript_28850/g.69302 Transcript_28850/m.69302 type:complete len:373 (-) Transcript_28850:9-1127(-)